MRVPCSLRLSVACQNVQAKRPFLSCLLVFLDAGDGCICEARVTVMVPLRGNQLDWSEAKNYVRDDESRELGRIFLFRVPVVAACLSQGMFDWSNKRYVRGDYSRSKSTPFVAVRSGRTFPWTRGSVRATSTPRRDS